MLDEKAKAYKLLADKLYEKCQKVQMENERCVMRINAIKKLTRRRVRDSDILKRRLDKYQDNWRTMPMVAPHPKRKIEQKRGPKPKNKNPSDEAQPKEKKARKQRMKKNVQEQNEQHIIVDPSTEQIQNHELMETTQLQQPQQQHLQQPQQQHLPQPQLQHHLAQLQQHMTEPQLPLLENSTDVVVN